MAKSVTSLSSAVLIYINRREKEREREGRLNHGAVITVLTD